jgi:uncharacterized integral membrane protein
MEPTIIIRANVAIIGNPVCIMLFVNQPWSALIDTEALLLITKSCFKKAWCFIVRKSVLVLVGVANHELMPIAGQ